MSKPRKLVAISADDYRILLDRIDEVSRMKPKETPVEKKLSSLDKKMNDILANDSLTEYQKLMAYSQVMRDYMEYTKQDQNEHSSAPNVIVTPPLNEPPLKEIKKDRKRKPNDNTRELDTTSSDYDYIMKNWITL